MILAVAAGTGFPRHCVVSPPPPPNPGCPLSIREIAVQGRESSQRGPPDPQATLPVWQDVHSEEGAPYRVLCSLLKTKTVAMGN